MERSRDIKKDRKQNQTDKNRKRTRDRKRDGEAERQSWVDIENDREKEAHFEIINAVYLIFSFGFLFPIIF